MVKPGSGNVKVQLYSSKTNPMDSSPRTVTLFGTVMLLRLLQPKNAYEPILVTLSGIVMLVRLSQAVNASFPMLVTLSGIVMLVGLSQRLNVFSSMLVMLFGILTFFYSHGDAYYLRLILVIQHTVIA